MSSNTTRPLEGVGTEPTVSREAPLVLGRYVLLEEVGSGGSGIVYRAYDPLLERPIAIKLLRARGNHALRARAVLREGRAIAQISHRNVVAVHDVGTHGDDTFVAMELLEGPTLRAWMAEKHALGEILEVFEQAARGLAAGHERGIVHRDFKPENVFVTAAGRVVVADFGLARAAESSNDEDDEPASPALSSNWDVRLTRTGAAPGTPGYMAPEQLRGDLIDARIDQFAWCVALWEGVFGERPFPRGDARVEIRAIEQGPIRPARPRHRVPRWLETLLRRGLSADREQRFRTLNDLIAALARRRHRRRLRLAALIAVGLLTSLAALGALRVPSSPCRLAKDQLKGVWDGSRRAMLDARFSASDNPLAGEARRIVQDRLVAYAAAWLGAQRSVCEATHVRHAQSETALDLRMECLGRRRLEFAALVTGLIELTGNDAPQRAVEALGSLTPLASCDDLRALSAGFPPLVEPERRKRANALRQELAQSQIMVATGRNEEARKRVEELVPKTRALAYPPLTADVLLQQGRVLHELGLFNEATPVLEEAARVAGGAHRDDVVGAALISLVLNCSYQHDDSRCVAMLGMVAPTMARLQEDSPVRFEFLTAAARAHAAIQRNDEALDYARRAERAALRDPARRSRALIEQLRALRNYGNRTAEAIRAADDAIAATIEAFGSRHPLVGDILVERGLVASLSDDKPTAVRDLTRALELFAFTQPPGHRRIARARVYLGGIAWREGRFEDATDLLTKARAVYAAEGGPTSEPVRHVDRQLAHVLFVSGRAAEARAAYRKVLDQVEQQSEPEPQERATLHASLCEASFATKLFEQARDEANRALELLAPVSKPDPGNVAFASDCLGRALLELGEARKAEGLLRAAAEQFQGRGTLLQIAANRYYLARAIWASGGDRTEARKLLDATLPDLERSVAIDASVPPIVAEARAFLANHQETSGAPAQGEPRK